MLVCCCMFAELSIFRPLCFLDSACRYAIIRPDSPLAANYGRFNDFIQNVQLAI